MSIVLTLGDTHCPGMKPGYVAHCQRVADRHGCDRFVHIGDAVDWHSINYHERKAGCSSARDEYRKALRQIAGIKRAFPELDWMIGNHDSLTERQAETAGLPSEVLRDYADLWQVDWTVHPRFSKLIIDGVIYSHGDSGRGGQDAAFKQAKDNFRSTVIGHFHAQAGAKWWANPEFRVFGMSVGCGIDASKLQFDYGRRIAAKPILGCGVVIDGKRAIFEPWLLKSR